MNPDEIGERLGRALQQRADGAVPPADGAEQIARQVQRRRRRTVRRRLAGGGAIAVGSLVVVVLVATGAREGQRVDTQQPLGPAVPATSTTTSPAEPPESDGLLAGGTSTSTAPTSASLPAATPVPGPTTTTSAVVMPPPATTVAPASRPGTMADVPWLTLTGLELTSASYVDEGETRRYAGPSIGWLSDDLGKTLVKGTTDSTAHDVSSAHRASDGSPLFVVERPDGGLTVIPYFGDPDHPTFSHTFYSAVGLSVDEAAHLVQGIESVVPSPDPFTNDTAGDDPSAYPFRLQTDDGTVLALAHRPTDAGYTMSFRVDGRAVVLEAAPAGAGAWRSGMLRLAWSPVTGPAEGKIDGDPAFVADLPDGRGVVAMSPNPYSVVVVHGDMGGSDLLVLLKSHLARTDLAMWRSLTDAVPGDR